MSAASAECRVDTASFPPSADALGISVHMDELAEAASDDLIGEDDLSVASSLDAPAAEPAVEDHPDEASDGLACSTSTRPERWLSRSS